MMCDYTGSTPMPALALRRWLSFAWIVVLALAGGCAGTAPVVEAPAPKLDVVWVPSAPEVIRAMLETAKVGPDDVVYDLGCGNGEIVIAAAKLYGARAVGIDLDPARIREAKLNAAQAAVTDQVTFVEQDLFATDVSPATVVTLYLLPDVNARLRPKLLRELRPGARIVSHDFGIGDWVPERTVEVPLDRTHRVFLWRIPGG
jgi:SAM-dependent methyltransferase